MTALESPADRRSRNARIVAAAAIELGTREAARRFNVDKNTVTNYLRLSRGIEPHSLVLKVKRDGPRGFTAEASGLVRQVRGKVRGSVRFRCTVEALTLREVLEAVVHQAMLAATARAHASR